MSSTDYRHQFAQCSLIEDIAIKNHALIDLCKSLLDRIDALEDELSVNSDCTIKHLLVPLINIRHIRKVAYNYRPRFGANSNKTVTAIRITFSYNGTYMAIRHYKHCIIIANGKNKQRGILYRYQAATNNYVSSAKSILNAKSLSVYRNTPITDGMFHELCLEVANILATIM